MKPVRLIWLLCLLFTSAQAEVKIGYVDMKILLDKSPQIIASRQQLEAEFRQRHEDLQAEEEKLRQQEEQLQTDGPFMSERERARLELDIRMRKRQIKRDREDFIEEMNYRRNEALQKLEKDIENAARRLAREQGFDLLLSSPVIYASDRIDITQAVLQKLQDEFQQKKEKASEKNAQP